MIAIRIGLHIIKEFVLKKLSDQELAIDVYLSLKDCREFSLRDQMNWTEVSIASNIAEGAERDSIKEFIHFIHIAKGSAQPPKGK